MRLLVRISIVTLASITAGTVVVACAPRAVTTLARAALPGCLYDVNVPAHRPPIIAVTIDDTPDANGTQEILDTLRAYSAHATFFVITNQIPAAESVMQRLRDEGHEIGNHFTADRPSIRLDSAAFERDLAAADSALRPYRPVQWARPGAGWYSRRMVRSIERSGYRCALGSVYPLDGTLAWPWLSSRYILAHVRPGAVVILHDRGDRAKRTAEVLGRVLPELRRRGYEIVTLTQLASASQ